MKLQKAFKVRIYPNKIQKVQLLKTLGCCRFIYNKMLAERKEVYERLKDNKRELYEYDYKTEKQYKEEFEFLKEADATALQQARRNLSEAYQNFFRRLKDPTVKKGEKGFPKFKKKSNRNSYRTPQNKNILRIDFKQKKIHLPKIKWISFRDKRILNNVKINSVTVSKTPSGKFFASVQYEVDIEDPKKVDTKTKNLRIKGLDMSLSHFFVDESGESPAYNRNYRNAEKKLSSLRSRFDKETHKCKKKQLRLRIARILEHTANCRKDFLEKLSDSLTKENDVIVVETLSLQDMAKSYKLGKSVNDLGWFTFLRRLKAKAHERGKIVIEANKWFASSKLCHVCGYKNDELALGVQEWICPQCGNLNLRDENAAINLRNYGLEFLTAGTAGIASSAVADAESQPSLVVG